MDRAGQDTQGLEAARPAYSTVPRAWHPSDSRTTRARATQTAPPSSDLRRGAGGGRAAKEPAKRFRLPGASAIEGRIGPRSARRFPMSEASPLTSSLLAGKRGLVMGVANNRSIAWGIAKACPPARARNSPSPTRATRWRSASTAGRRARRRMSSAIATSPTPPPSTRSSPRSSRVWGRLDFVVHCIAFSDKDELTGRYVETTRGNFTKTLLISCYSFTAVAQRAEKLMTQRRLAADADLLRRREVDAALQRHGRRQGRARGQRALSRRRSRREEHPRQRHLGRARSRRWRRPASATSATS